jgi:hypothetical protein
MRIGGETLRRHSAQRYNMTTLVLSEQKVNTTRENNPIALWLQAGKSSSPVYGKVMALSIRWFMTNDDGPGVDAKSGTEVQSSHLRSGVYLIYNKVEEHELGYNRISEVSKGRSLNVRKTPENT